MNSLKVFSNICSIVIMALVFSFFLILLTGLIKLGHIPNYGIDPDPTNLKIDILNYILAFPLFLSIIAIPLWFLLHIHFIFNNIYMSKCEISLFSIALVGLISILIVKFYFSSQFYWVFD